MEFTVETKERDEIIDITGEVERIVSKHKIKDGICLVYVPHATAALTVNENADPGIAVDFLTALDRSIPQGIWKHDRIDNNGASHIKAAIIGPDVMIPVKNSKLILGTWQGIMLCEFDGPRQRRIIVEVVGK